jgi:putative two-component system response regulator
MNSKKILAVDDVAINLRAIKTALDKFFKVRIANSGVLALEIIGKEEIDLILLDIEMPGMSGFEFMHLLKAKYTTGTLGKIPPVIFVTANATPELLVQAKAAGAVGYIIKPFDPKALFDHVLKVLELS